MCFSEKYGLHDAVLAGRKTQTRRLIPQSILDKVDAFQLQYYEATLDRLDGTELIEQFFIIEAIGKLPFKAGDVVAIAERYKDANIQFIPEEDDEFGCHNFPAEQTKGWDNKMFVRADLMPHQIRIKRVWFERLQDISDEDCIAEGVIKETRRIATEAEQYLTHYYPCQTLKDAASQVGWGVTYAMPKIAYSVLIDRISGKGTWDRNPYVIAYEFELVK